MNSYGYQGQRAGDPWTHNSNSNSTVSKMEHTFWVTKQSVFRKFGKKEDECVVASDAELDAKLELFRSVQDTCQELQRVLDKYQERLCNLAQEESAMGRFLKEASKRDQTNAGKAMTAVGKSLAYSGQQRLCLRVPLQRLYQEVETFRQRAIEDTLLNVSAMERQRTEYRAALSWMKNVSQELDPDTFKQLEKFRKVQGQVRQSKARFDKLKLDCLQKVDLLAAARCNMFSHALTLYQTALLQHARRANRAYSTVAKQIKGYQHYEFSVVPELTEESSRLAKQTSEAASSAQEGEEEADKDELLFFDSEFHDKAENAETSTSGGEAHKSDSLQNLLSSGSDQNLPPLIPFDTESKKPEQTDSQGLGDIDLLASDCLGQLDDLLSTSLNDVSSPNDDWVSLFGGSILQSGSTGVESDIHSLDGAFSALDGGKSTVESNVDSNSANGGAFLPSQLLDHFASTLQLNTPLKPAMSQSVGESGGKQQPPAAANIHPHSASTTSMGFMTNFMANLRPGTAAMSTNGAGPVSPTEGPLTNVSGAVSSKNSSPSIQDRGKGANPSKKDMSAWYDLFADLDPLANPDALGALNLEEERNC